MTKLNQLNESLDFTFIHTSSSKNIVLDYCCTGTVHFLDYFVVQCVQLYNIKPTKTIVFNHFCVHYNHFIAPKVYSATTLVDCSNCGGYVSFIVFNLQKRVTW